MNTVRQTLRGTINVQYFNTLVAVLFTWLLHEFAHWFAGEILGNEMEMSLNSSYPLAEEYRKQWHAILISAAGPVVTLIQATVFYCLLKKMGNKLLFPFLLTTFYMRLLAGVMNLIMLNDEGRVSKDLGLGVYTLPLAMIAILFYLVYDIIKTKGFSAKFIVGNFLLIMLFSSILILADQALKLVIL